MENVFLGLGSNQGDRRSALEKALQYLEEKAGKIVRRSAVYETEAWGYREQPAFLNMCVELRTGLVPAELMAVIFTAETAMGRKRNEKWREREIDIDILFFGERVIRDDSLEIPHPHLQLRRFVLVPLADIAPDRVHPVLKKTVSELLAVCPDNLQAIKTRETPHDIPPHRD